MTVFVKSSYNLVMTYFVRKCITLELKLGIGHDVYVIMCVVNPEKSFT